MNLSEFLDRTENLADFEDLFPSATGVRSTPWGTAPVYSDEESWEADFSETCVPPRQQGSELTQPYARHTRGE